MGVQSIFECDRMPNVKSQQTVEFDVALAIWMNFL
jgi:hypothetical protein